MHRLRLQALHHSLGHAFANAVLYLDYNRVGFPYPIVPVAINCYGRRVISQRGGFPNFERTLTKATSIRRRRRRGACSTSARPRPDPGRFALAGGVLASSGWSHAFLTEKNHFLYPDTPADRRMYEALRSGDYQTWRNHTALAVEDSGQQELLNWMCLAGALQELGRKPASTEFIDTWIFNSSKAFLIAPP
jgi:hypothetical protein